MILMKREEEMMIREGETMMMMKVAMTIMGRTMRGVFAPLFANHIIVDLHLYVDDVVLIHSFVDDVGLLLLGGEMGGMMIYY